MSAPIIQLAQLQALPGQGERLAALLVAIRDEAVQAEDGCLEFRVTEMEDGVSFVCWEVYKDAEAVQAHGKQAALQNLVTELSKGDLLAFPPELKALVEL